MKKIIASSLIISSIITIPIFATPAKANWFRRETTVNRGLHQNIVGVRNITFSPKYIGVIYHDGSDWKTGVWYLHAQQTKSPILKTKYRNIYVYIASNYDDAYNGVNGNNRYDVDMGPKFVKYIIPIRDHNLR